MFDCHIFVCENARQDGHIRGCCASKGSAEFLQSLKELCNNGRKSGELKTKVRVNKSGCLDKCEKGAIVVVYPEGVWYQGITKQDAEEIYSSHILNGKPVQRLVFKSAT